MDASSILERARSGNPPSEWNVWPLRQDFVRVSAIKWALLGVVGFGLLIPAGFATIPSDFTSTDSAARLFAMIILILLATIAFGGIGIAIHDVWRLTHARDYWLIITPETFIKAEPGRVIETPLEHIHGLTLKGVSLPTGENSSASVMMSPFPMTNRMISFANAARVPGVSHKRARGNASLAYRDMRSNKIVTVCTDDSFDQMGAIYELLSSRRAVREDQVRRAAYQSPRA